MEVLVALVPSIDDCGKDGFDDCCEECRSVRFLGMTFVLAMDPGCAKYTIEDVSPSQMSLCFEGRLNPWVVGSWFMVA